MRDAHPQPTLDAPTTAAPATPTDAALIEHSLLDPAAFAAIFDRHWAAIHGYCARRAAAAGEDLAAEAFRLAFDHRARYDLAQPDARPWLFGIAANLVRQHFRTTQRGERAHRRAATLEAADHVDEPIGRIEAQALGSELVRALEALSVGDREALLLFAWAELDYAGIARALDLPIGTVRSRIHRARTRVREHLSRSLDQGADDDH